MLMKVDVGPGPHWSLVGKGCLWSHLQCAGGVGGENLLQHHGNLPTEPWQHAALLSQVAQHLLNNLGLCLTFPGKVPRQLPCPHSTGLAGLQLC